MLRDFLILGGGISDCRRILLADRESGLERVSESFKPQTLQNVFRLGMVSRVTRERNRRAEVEGILKVLKASVKALVSWLDTPTFGAGISCC